MKEENRSKNPDLAFYSASSALPCLRRREKKEEMVRHRILNTKYSCSEITSRESSIYCLEMQAAEKMMLLLMCPAHVKRE